MEEQIKKAIVLLSGGLDSTTILYYALDKGYEVNCLIFEYGQKHYKEVERAVNIAKQASCKYSKVKISLPWKGSSLLDDKMVIPKNLKIDVNKIPSTYVPARNIIFLSFAASYAEATDASAIFIGANAIDYSGYPDCRPEFFDAYQNVLKTGLKTGVEDEEIIIHAPLIDKTKDQIIELGLELSVPYGETWSCYSGGKIPCGECDSCVLRQRGFKKLNINDPVFDNF